MRKSIATLTCLILVAALAAMGFPSPAFSQEGKGKSTDDGQSSPLGDLVYKPPLRGAPAGGARVGAAVRGGPGEGLTIVVLAPDHVGATCQKQPILYWYASKATSSRIEFTVNDEKAGKTIIKADLSPPQKEGIQSINLADYKAELSPDVTYQWFVTLETAPDHPDEDVFNAGSIVYLEPPAGLDAKLKTAGGVAALKIYAEEGFWYDALSAAWKPMKPQEEKTVKKLRASLFAQGGFGVTGPGKSKPVLDGEMEALQFLNK